MEADEVASGGRGVSPLARALQRTESTRSLRALSAALESPQAEDAAAVGQPASTVLVRATETRSEASTLTRVWEILAMPFSSSLPSSPTQRAPHASFVAGVGVRHEDVAERLMEDELARLQGVLPAPRSGRRSSSSSAQPSPPPGRVSTGAASSPLIKQALEPMPGAGGAGGGEGKSGSGTDVLEAKLRRAASIFLQAVLWGGALTAVSFRVSQRYCGDHTVISYVLTRQSQRLVRAEHYRPALLLLQAALAWNRLWLGRNSRPVGHNYSNLAVVSALAGNEPLRSYYTHRMSELNYARLKQRMARWFASLFVPLVS